MNALAPDFNVNSAAPPRARVAVLVDGENISTAFAGQIILKSAGYGDLIIKRVYGNVQKTCGWDAAPGFRMVHSGIGKNATDLLLSVEAVALILRGQAEILVIAASDRDYTHLATHLTEAGHKVIGLGEAKAPEAFRKSCTRFLELVLPVKSAPKRPASVAPIAAKSSSIDDHILAMMAEEGGVGGILIGRLGARMHTVHKVKIGETLEKTWRAYLLARPHLFNCDPRGPLAKVHLKSLSSAPHSVP